MFGRAMKAFLLFSLLALPALAVAGQPAASDTQAQIAALQQAMRDAQAANASAQSAGDNAWMLTSAALVLLMTGPGLALFYGGLVRRKNILGTMMQSFAMMGLVTILWAIVGYSLAFGHGNAFVGGFEHLFLRGVGLTPNTDYAGTIPEQTYMIYQLMFAIITPALITGAFAERMKFSCHGGLSLALVAVRVLPHGAHGVGRGRPLERDRQPHSQPGFRRRNGSAYHQRRLRAGDALCIWASALAIRIRPCRLTLWRSASLARACCGWAGLALTPAARSEPVRWPPALS